MGVLFQARYSELCGSLPSDVAVTYDTIVITYDAAGHVLREVPFVFVG